MSFVGPSLTSLALPETLSGGCPIAWVVGLVSLHGYVYRGESESLGRLEVGRGRPSFTVG